MKLYKPKRLLRKAIEATQASLDRKWKLANKGDSTYDAVSPCKLCFIAAGCEPCPLMQFTNSETGCSPAYRIWYDARTPTTFMAVRRELQATLRWLQAQK